MSALWRRAREVQEERLREAIQLVRAYLAELGKLIEIREAYLFGSIARGDSLDTSDIDLLVVSPSVRGMRPDERRHLAYSVWRARRAADIIVLTPEELEEALEKSVVLRDASKYWVRVA